jgi:hypothetical protein
MKQLVRIGTVLFAATYSFGSLAVASNETTNVAGSSEVVELQQGVNGYVGAQSVILNGGRHQTVDPSTHYHRWTGTGRRYNIEYFNLDGLETKGEVVSASLTFYRAGGWVYTESDIALRRILDPDNLGSGYPTGWHVAEGFRAGANLESRDDSGAEDVKWQSSDPSSPDDLNADYFQGVLNPLVQSAIYHPKQSDPNGFAYDLDVTADIQCMIQGSCVNQGWALYHTNDSANIQYVTATSAHADASLRPKLTIQFAPDELEPLVLSSLPNGGGVALQNNKISLSLKTDEVSECRYGNSRAEIFDQMPFAFDSTNAVDHSAYYGSADLEGSQQQLYARCRDASGNTTITPHVFYFEVLAEASGSTDSGSTDSGSDAIGGGDTDSGNTDAGSGTDSGNSDSGDTGSNNDTAGSGDGSDTGTGSDSSGQAGTSPVEPQTYFVRTDGGTLDQCDGRSNSAYTGTGSNCAVNHLFELLPPEKEPLINGGDTVIVADGEYRMGYTEGVYDSSTSKCSSHWPYSCVMPSIPSGPSPEQPTRILGEGWQNGCATKPKLVGVERARQIFNLSGSNNVELQCMELTDGAECTTFYLHGYSNSSNANHQEYLDTPYRCNRDSYPYGDWASKGIHSYKSDNVLVKNLNVHGFTSRGVMAGGISNWTLEDVDIIANGLAGFDSDVDSVTDDSNSGDIVFRRSRINWNGCVEKLDGSIGGCWGQSAGGYGDGLGANTTSGNWLFEQVEFMYNTSDGLDLLYGNDSATITIRQSRFEGNAGNQLKVAGKRAEITNSIVISNCAFFEDKAFDDGVTPCRAGGNSLSLNFTHPDSSIAVLNSYITGNGDGLLGFGARGMDKLTAGNHLVLANNIFEGDWEYHSPGDKTFYIYSIDDPDKAVNYTLRNNQIGGEIKFSSGFPGCPEGVGDFCVDPIFEGSNASSDRRNVKPAVSNPGVDAGIDAGTLLQEFSIPSVDFEGSLRPKGGAVDVGPYELSL